MRDFKGMKRQRGRNRGGGGGGQGGGKPGQNANRAFDSNGPENIKVRGHAQHVYEKYNQLARDAASGDDRVLAENYLQHAEHYFRTLRVLQPQRPVTEIVGRDTFVNGFDLDFEDEAVETAMEEADAAASQAGAPQPSVEGEAPAEGRQGGDRPFRDRNERFDRDRDRPQGDRGDRFDRERQNGGERGERFDRDRQQQDRGDRQGGDRPRFENNRRERWEDRGDRQGGGRGDRQPADRPERGENGDRPFERDRPRRDRWEERPPAAETVDTAVMVAPDSAPPPRATFESSESDGRVLRSEDGGVSEAPAFLSASGPAPTEDGEPRRPRQRRPRRRTEEGDAPREPETEEV